MSFEWPSREQRARDVRTVFSDMENPHKPSSDVLDYATHEEVESAIVVLNSWRLAYFRAERAAYKSLGRLGRQRGESARQYDLRRMEMSREDRDRISDALPRGPYPYELNEVIKDLRGGAIHWRLVHLTEKLALGPPLSAIITRYQKANARADEIWHREVAARPIDDAAWNRELARRQHVEEYLATGPTVYRSNRSNRSFAHK